MSIKYLLLYVSAASVLHAGIGDYADTVKDAKSLLGGNTNSITSTSSGSSSPLSSIGQTVNTASSLTRGVSSVLNSDATTKVVTNIFGAVGVNNSFFIQPLKIPGLAGLNIQCDLSNSGRRLDVCEDIFGGIEDGIIGGLNKLLNILDKGVSIGPCRTGLEIRRVCQTDLLQDSCKAIKGLTKSAFSSIKENTVGLTPVSTLVSAVGEMAKFGEEIVTEYLKDHVPNSCLAILPRERSKKITVGNKGKTITDLQNSNFNSKNILQHGVQRSGGQSLYSPEMYTWQECIYTHPDNPEICDSKNYRLPTTYADSQAEIDTMRIKLSDGLEKTDTFEQSLLLGSNYAQQCAGSSDQAACESQIYENGYKVINSDGTIQTVKPKEVKQRRHEDVERSVSYFSSLVKGVKNENSYYGLMNEELAQTVPVEQRGKFRQKALVEMKKDTLFDYFVDRIKYSKKEIVDIEQNLLKVSASQFNSQEALKEVEAIIAYFESKQQQ